MIPKRIFYVWGINDEKKRDVLACMQSWRQNCPDYEIIEINENSKKYFNFENELKQNKWFKTVYDKKMWAYVADYVRIKVLYENGGIYLDTDVTVIKNFDKFLNDPAFVGIQCSGRWNYVEPAILGAQKHNDLLKKIIEFYFEKIWEEPIYTMPQIFEYYLQRIYNIYEYPQKNKQQLIKLKDIYIYPERFFIPFEYGQKFTPECIEKDTYTIHWFGGSWLKPEIRYFLENKHKNIQNALSLKNYRIWKLFGFLPVMKTYQDEKNTKNKKLFCTHCLLFTLIPFLKFIKYDNGYKIKFFNVTFLRQKDTLERKITYLFDFIPLLKIRIR